MLIRPFSFWGGGSGGAPFDPTAINDLSFWYDIEDSTLTDVGGGEISAIEDLSGNAEDAVQATSADRAILVADEFGTLDALDFVSSDFYSCGSDTITTTGTFFVVAKADALHLGMLIGQGASSNDVAGAMLRVTGDGDVQVIIGNGTSRANSTLASAYSAGSVICAIGRWDSSTIDLDVNGTAATQTAHSLGSLGSLGTRIGLTAFNPFNGKMGAAGRYSVRITDQEVDDLMGYLQGRFS